MTSRSLAALAALALAGTAAGVSALGAQQQGAPPKGQHDVAATFDKRVQGVVTFDRFAHRNGTFDKVVQGTYDQGGALEGKLSGQVHGAASLDARHPDDPADSLYRVAWQLFSRQEYRAAADRFADMRAKFPNTRYLCDASYYEAFARYRLGTPADLRTAHRVLDGMGTRCGSEARLKDVPELIARVDGALARLGDSEAADRLRRAASEGRRVCDREERNVKIQALSALAQMDAAGSRPVLESVLAQKDECSAPVRREALQLVARGGDAQAVTLLSRSARNDPDAGTRVAAVEALSRLAIDPAFTAMEELLRTSTDEHVQSAAVRAMAKSDSPRAQSTLRALVDRQDVSERLRASVIASLGQRGGTTTEYWRALYAKLESDELRGAVVNAVDRNTGDGMQFLLSIAGNASQPSAVRALAVQRVRQAAPVADLYRLFESADSRSIRQAIVSGLAARREPEATDRLIDIAKRGTDPEVRAAAIRYLGQPARRDDPKVRQALADILGGQS
jgi:HEAT repeat protein